MTLNGDDEQTWMLPILSSSHPIQLLDNAVGLLHRDALWMEQMQQGFDSVVVLCLATQGEFQPDAAVVAVGYTRMSAMLLR